MIKYLITQHDIYAFESETETHYILNDGRKIPKEFLNMGIFDDFDEAKEWLLSYIKIHKDCARNQYGSLSNRFKRVGLLTQEVICQ